MAPGQAIAYVYSPTYIAAQEEYILAFDGVKKLQGAGADVVQMNNRLLDAAKRKLLLIGVPAGEIEHLGHMHKANTHMTVRAQFGGSVMDKLVLPGSYIMPGDKLYNLADLSNVWMFADIYEKDIAAISLGQSVSVTSPAYPGESFGGEVQFINPVLDDATRTVKVRVSMANPDGKLKPNLFVNASIQLPLADSLVIPASSLLDTGLRRVVFVATAEDTFVKRDVVTGQEADGYVQVLSGISQGETVVTSATFLIDSQTQLGQYGSHAGHGGAKAGGAVPAAGPQTQKAAPGNSMPDMPGMPATPAAPAAPAGPAPNPHAGH
jgi:Cu(I)/Ag(I) efflux system membrane fusion protein